MCKEFEKTLLAIVSRNPADTISTVEDAAANTMPNTPIAIAAAMIRYLRSKRSTSGAEASEPSGYPAKVSAT
jgi:hypothetical protein